MSTYIIYGLLYKLEKSIVDTFLNRYAELSLIIIFSALTLPHYVCRVVAPGNDVAASDIRNAHMSKSIQLLCKYDPHSEFQSDNGRRLQRSKNVDQFGPTYIYNVKPWFAWEFYEYSLIITFFSFEAVRIWSFGPQPDVSVKKYLEDMRRRKTQKGENSTIKLLRHYSDGSIAYWQDEASVTVKDLEHIAMKEEVKDMLLKDVDEFVSEPTMERYLKRSIRYKRGYLLHGPPGTGKSSLASAVALRLNRPVYLFQIRQLTDATLQELFEELPDFCIALFEDAAELNTKSVTTESTKSESNGNPVSLSTLLNITDGIWAPKGLITFLTTNHIETIDGTLLRSGRFDKHIAFSLLERQTTAQTFRFICGSSQEEADAFARLVPEGVFSPVDLQNYLLESDIDGELAMQNVASWVNSKQDSGPH